MRAWAFEHGVMWAMDLADGRTIVPMSAQVVAVFGEVRSGNAEPLSAAMGLPSAQLVLRRFATGRRCFAAWVEGQIAAYGWVSQATECIGELEREIQIGADEAYIWNCATLPSYRRRRLYTALLSHIIVQLRGQGVRRVWIGSSVHNRPSLRAFAKAGFLPVVRLVYMRLFNLSGSWMPGYPDAPGELVAVARRALTADHEHRWGVVSVGRSRSTLLPACAQIEG